jgi:DNA-binding NarL/FixJ family response regulator
MRILIADDHTLFREGLRMVLAPLVGETLIAEAGSFDEAVDAVHDKSEFRLLLLDMMMPGMDWREALLMLKQACPGTPVVFISAVEEGRLIREAINLGACGFISKSVSSKVMLSAIELVLSGGVYVPPAVLAISDQIEDHSLRNHLSNLLTNRQRQVMELLNQGLSNKEIARQLELSDGTVKLHITAILKALNVDNRTKAVIEAKRLGLTQEAGA